MRNYIIFSILVIVGLVLLVLQTNLTTANTFWYNTLGNVANTLLVGGTLSLLYNIFVKNSEDENLMRMMKISFSIHDSGLRQILTNSSDYKFSGLLIKSESFVAIMNDGLRWVGNHSPELEQRFNKASTNTEFFLVDPNSRFCEALAIKTNVTLLDLQNKIKQTVSLIESTYQRSSQRGKLCIYLMKNYPTQSIFMTEDKIVTTPYQVASGRNTIPLFEYDIQENRKTIAFHISNDVENVRRESQTYVSKP